MNIRLQTSFEDKANFVPTEICVMKFTAIAIITIILAGCKFVDKPVGLSKADKADFERDSLRYNQLYVDRDSVYDLMDSLGMELSDDRYLMASVDKSELKGELFNDSSEVAFYIGELFLGSDTVQKVHAGFVFTDSTVRNVEHACNGTLERTQFLAATEHLGIESEKDYVKLTFQVIPHDLLLNDKRECMTFYMDSAELVVPGQDRERFNVMRRYYSLGDVIVGINEEIEFLRERWAGRLN